jgi:hypothetical protein
MNPSALPWWVWLGGGIIAAGFGLAMRNAAQAYRTRFGLFISMLFLLSGIVASVIGVIRFVKWVWTG